MHEWRTTIRWEDWYGKYFTRSVQFVFDKCRKKCTLGLSSKSVCHLCTSPLEINNKDGNEHTHTFSEPHLLQNLLKCWTRKCFLLENYIPNSRENFLKMICGMVCPSGKERLKASNNAVWRLRGQLNRLTFREKKYLDSLKLSFSLGFCIYHTNK